MGLLLAVLGLLVVFFTFAAELALGYSPLAWLARVVCLSPLASLAFAAWLWPRAHACPATILLEPSSYRTQEWHTPFCSKCAWAPVRRIASTVMAALGVALFWCLVSLMAAAV
jgi:hypothetical protein